MHFRELFQGSSIAFIFRMVSALASYVFIYFLAHTYDETAVGIFSTSWTILMIGSVFGKMGFDTSIVRFMAESASDHSYLRMRMIYRRSLKITIIASLIVAAIIVALSGHLTEWFYDSIEVSWMVMLVGIGVIPYSLMSFNAESLKGLKKIFPFSVHQNVSVYFGALIILAVLHQFYSDYKFIIVALVGILVILMISSFSTFKYFLRFYPKHDSFYSKSIPKSGKIIGTTLPMMLTNSLFLVLNWTDVLMIGAMMDDGSVGIYNTALKIAALNSLVLIAVNSIAMPKYAELFQKNKVLFKQLVKSVSFLSFVVTLPVFLIIVIFPQFVMGIFNFDTGYQALIILAVGQLFATFSGSTIHLLNMTGKEKITMYVLLFSVVINFAMNFILIPLLGINGAAWATAISTVVWNLLAVIMIYRYNRFFTYPLLKPQQIRHYIKILFDKKSDERE